jgi:hypothetical protein
MEALPLMVDQPGQRTEQRARREAKASYDLLDEVTESTPDVVFVKDRDGRFVQVNASLARISGSCARWRLASGTKTSCEPRRLLPSGRSIGR